MKAIIGKKVGMSPDLRRKLARSSPSPSSRRGPCTVVQKKTSDKEGYEAVQLGYEDIPERKLPSPKWAT